MSQQTTASLFGQGYMHAMPSFLMPNLGLAPYTPECNSRTYANTNGDYQTPYSTVAYTNPIPLLDSSVRFWLNYANNNMIQYNTYGQSEHGGFGYETPPQFPFRPQQVEMMLARAITEPCADPNNLTTQLATILRVFWYRTQWSGTCLSKTLPQLLRPTPLS
jgi:hypothetical protein